MWIDILLGAAVFAATSFLSWLLLRFLITKLREAKQVDEPNERTLHQGSVPRGGGLVISLTMVLALFSATIMSTEKLFFSVFTVLMLGWTALSWWEDRAELAPGVRFIPQLLFAVTTIAAFGWINQLAGVYLGLFGSAITLVGIIWMANLYNFMDGIDGLAASQAIVASLTLAVWLYFLANPILALVCVMVAAASYGFLLSNWQPAQIFMGDVGSVTLGAFFATLMIILETRHNVPVLSIMLVFGVFILDTSATVLLRIARREPFWRPHRKHIYQRLVQSGLSHQIVTTSSIVLMLGCSALATISLTQHAMIVVFIVIEIAVYAVIWAYCHYRELNTISP